MNSNNYIGPARTTTTAVLMSTFNGEKYLQAQIESILDQLNPDDALIIRDDGSSDSTLMIAEAYANKDTRVKVIAGTNLGFANSFFWLLNHISTDFDVYMLSDQDDIWLPTKIDVANQEVAQEPLPTLHCTRLKIVDEKLNPLGLSPNFSKRPQLWNALCENIVTGCTAALNKEALHIICSIPYETLSKQKLYYHDWWLYLCLSTFGQVKFDERSNIFYRQHGNNMVGMGKGLKRYTKIIRNLLHRPWTPLMANQIKVFQNLYGGQLRTSAPKDAAIIQQLASGSDAATLLKSLICHHFIRQSAGGKIMLRILIIFELITRRSQTKN